MTFLLDDWWSSLTRDITDSTNMSRAPISSWWHRLENAQRSFLSDRVSRKYQVAPTHRATGWPHRHQRGTSYHHQPTLANPQMSPGWTSSASTCRSRCSSTLKGLEVHRRHATFARQAFQNTRKQARKDFNPGWRTSIPLNSCRGLKCGYKWRVAFPWRKNRQFAHLMWMITMKDFYCM